MDERVMGGGEFASQDPLQEIAILQRKIGILEGQLTEEIGRAQKAEARLAEAEAYIYELQLAVMEAEIAAEEQIAEAHGELREARTQLDSYVMKLFVSQGEVEELRLANKTDKLTGLANREALDEALPRAEADPELEIISFDANGFGKINKIKEYGPAEGDIQIRRVANAIRIAARGFGVSPRNVFRRGGDEFVVIVPKGEVEYITRNSNGEVVSTGDMSVADAIIRRAVELYKHRRYSGTYGDELEPLETVVSLSGSSGDTFEDADKKLQAIKQARKQELDERFGRKP